MTRILEPFKVVKPVIGVIHLKTLPGSPYGGNSIDDVLVDALSDLDALIEGGVDGVIVENYMDKPFPKRVSSVETIASYTVIVWEIRKRAGKPVGLSLLRNSGVEAMAIACVTGADFIRVNALAEPVWSPEGLLEPIAYELHCLRSRLGCGVRVYADVNVKHSKPIMDLDTALHENIDRGLADAVIVTGAYTGGETDPIDIAIVRRQCSKPVIVGSGIRVDNIQLYWDLVDGFIVGTYFKKDGIVVNPVDRRRVESLMEVVYRLRSHLDTHSVSST